MSASYVFVILCVFTFFLRMTFELILVGVFIGVFLARLADCCRWRSIRTNLGNSTVFSGNLVSRSVVQSNGHVWIDGEEVGSGQRVSASCTKSLRITADGEVLNSRLQPGTPIHIRVEPGVIFNDLQVGDDCVIQGSVALQSMNVGDDLTVTGNITSQTINVGDDVRVNGDVYCDRLSADDDISISGKRKRRNSSLR